MESIKQRDFYKCIKCGKTCYYNENSFIFPYCKRCKLKGETMKQKEVFGWKLKKFERYFKKQNFNGSAYHLKGNILNRFKEIFEDELKEVS